MQKLNPHDLSVLVETQSSTTTHCIFIAYEPNGDSYSHFFSGTKNTAYNCILAYLTAHPNQAKEIADAINDFLSERGKPHSRPE